MHLSTAEGRGKLIAVIGLDGAGKTTQVTMLGEWLTSLQMPATAQQSLTLSPVRKALTAIAVEDGLETYLDIVDGETIRLISACTQLARVSAVERHLNSVDELVILDRYTYCQYALAEAEGVGDVQFLRRLLGGALKPDLTIFLDVSPAEAFKRINARGIDEESLEFLEAFRNAYIGLPEAADFVTIDGDGNPNSVQAALRKAVSQVLN